MIFFPNATVEIAIQTVSKNAEGTKIKKFDFSEPIASFRADVQPNTLTEYQIELYGINTKNANTKKMFFDESHESVTVGTRAKVTEDDGTIGIYRVQPLNKWRGHCEALLIPVEGE